MFKNTLLVAFAFLILSCGQKIENNQDTKKADKIQIHNHSYSNIDAINTKHLHLDITVDFESKQIKGVARHTMHNTGTKKAIFDVNQLNIEKVTTGSEGNETEVTFHIGQYDSILGAPLVVDIQKTASLINIYYSTSPNAVALDWLDSNLTGSNQPFLYTQGESILTRSWIPIQDTPENRITYSADVKVPQQLLALMSAKNPTKKSETGQYHFEMKQAIPSYLIALAVGDLKFAQLGKNCGVYAEPYMINAASEEFQHVPAMIAAAESLYGPYRWGEYDVLVLPYSFPYGGMENPRLTFATPTIISGDGSLVTLVAHELAHSWSGNLVTMSSWDDFWLNEGFTMYFENRIMEKVFGKDVATMLAGITYQDLQDVVKKLIKNGHPEDTHLKLNLEGRNPDEGMTDIAYCKGFFFLKTLENVVGRAKFDTFLRSYFDTYKFQSITTEDFVSFLNKNLLDKYNIKFNADEWIYESGIPDNIVFKESDRFKKAGQMAESVKNGVGLPADLKLKDKTTQEWLAFIRAFDGKLSKDKMKKLDEQFNFKDANAEIKTEWYVLAIKNDYDALLPKIRFFLIKVGRMKFLQPIYTALAEHSEASKKWADDVYLEARPHYHPLSKSLVDGILVKR